LELLLAALMQFPGSADASVFTHLSTPSQDRRLKIAFSVQSSASVSSCSQLVNVLVSIVLNFAVMQ
jgi:hypothetical protein